MGFDNNDIETIKLGIGLGELRFGSTQEQTKTYLGEPEEIAEDEIDGEISIAWYYWSRGISAYFDEADDFRLGGIETSLPSASLNGLLLIGKSVNEVLELVRGMDVGEPEEEICDLEEDGDAGGRRFYFESRSLGLWFEDDVLADIQWGCFVDEDDQSVWPR